MQRRSQRILLTTSSKPVYVDESDSGGVSDYESPPPRKTRKISHSGASKTKTIRGRRGKLQSIMEMPLDILFEIFAHLSPSDLLHLARTAKRLRNTLMHRSANSVWKKARSYIEVLRQSPSPFISNLMVSSNKEL
ncbi:hypothetical protein H0H81_008400 [Sphagnurus paluster]|uniref:F-box domain-containing protein n=1 Tax=Sphagnurus paluster TaxID=117069 RepID=A0A9P7KGH3_9AGAR|nr:hypothetical protein H0H81_008400 [Sphagnurus paluster]